jgi:hypothetical protein
VRNPSASPILIKELGIEWRNGRSRSWASDWGYHIGHQHPAIRRRGQEGRRILEGNNTLSQSAVCPREEHKQWNQFFHIGYIWV